MTHSLRECLIDLVGTYSPTGEEDMATGKFLDYLSGLGATGVHVDAAGNAAGTFEGTGMGVTLCGHIDTVPGELPVEVRNGVLTGRGSVDAKSSLMALLFGARMAKQKGFRGRIDVIAAIGEEGPGKGIIEVAASHRKMDYAVLGEPSGTFSITAGYRGRLLIDVETRSGSHHASAPWMEMNAIEKAMCFWDSVRETYGQSRDFSRVSAAITSMCGGEADNVTPSRAGMTLDIRFPPSRKQGNLFNELETLFLEGGTDHGGYIRLRSSVDPYVANMKSPLAKAFKSAIISLSGQNPSMLFKSGSGDMNILGTSWGIPCITYGPGNPQLSHTDHEEISLDEVEKSAAIVAESLVTLQQMHSGN